MCKPKGSVVTKVDELTPFVGPNGNTVFACGAWNNVSWCNSIRGMLNAAVTARGEALRGYHEFCPECVARHGDGDRTGCNHHSHNARLYRYGNPSLHIMFITMIKKLKDWFKHVPQVAGHLSPKEFIQCRNVLCNMGNNKECLQTYVMSLTSIHSFMRKGEAEKHHEDNFITELHMLQKLQELPKALCHKVKGKWDGNKWTYLYLYRNDEYPELCPVRHLLVYLHAIGWKGGFIFPTTYELHNPPEDGVYLTQIADDDLYRRVNILWIEVLKKGDKRLGFHTFRKTGYLWAMIGNAHVESAMQAARHKTFTAAKEYILGAKSLGVHIRLSGDTRNMCGEWIDPFCGEHEHHIQVSSGMSAKPLTLAECATMFVVDVQKG